LRRFHQGGASSTIKCYMQPFTDGWKHSCFVIQCIWISVFTDVRFCRSWCRAMDTFCQAVVCYSACKQPLYHNDLLTYHHRGSHCCACVHAGLCWCLSGKLLPTNDGKLGCFSCVSQIIIFYCCILITVNTQLMRLHLIVRISNGLHRTVGWWIIGLTGFQTVMERSRVWVWVRGMALIDRLISQELSASPNLIGDQAAHPVCDH